MVILIDFEGCKFYIIFIPYSESSGIDLRGAAILVMWSCLLPLLAKCTHQGCGAAVNPENMVTHRNGKIVIYFGLSRQYPIYLYPSGVCALPSGIVATINSIIVQLGQD